MIIEWFDQVPLKEDIEIVGVQVTAIAHRKHHSYQARCEKIKLIIETLHVCQMYEEI